MGFAAPDDDFCRRGDAALQGITNCVKVVNDVLIYDEELLPHLHRVNNVLARCRAHSRHYSQRGEVCPLLSSADSCSPWTGLLPTLIK